MAEDRILYIGKSKSLRSRVRSYFRDSHELSPRISLMVRQICEIEFIVTDSEAEALALESNLIKAHQPHFNVLLKDDQEIPLSLHHLERALPAHLHHPAAAAAAAPWTASTAPTWMWPVAPHPVSGQTGVPAAAKGPSPSTASAPA